MLAETQSRDTTHVQVAARTPGPREIPTADPNDRAARRRYRPKKNRLKSASRQERRRIEDPKLASPTGNESLAEPDKSPPENTFQDDLAWELNGVPGDLMGTAPRWVTYSFGALFVVAAIFAPVSGVFGAFRGKPLLGTCYAFVVGMLVVASATCGASSIFLDLPTPWRRFLVVGTRTNLFLALVLLWIALSEYLDHRSRHRCLRAAGVCGSVSLLWMLPFGAELEVCRWMDATLLMGARLASLGAAGIACLIAIATFPKVGTARYS